MLASFQIESSKTMRNASIFLKTRRNAREFPKQTFKNQAECWQFFENKMECPRIFKSNPQTQSAMLAMFFDIHMGYQRFLKNKMKRVKQCGMLAIFFETKTECSRIFKSNLQKQSGMLAICFENKTECPRFFKSNLQNQGGMLAIFLKITWGVNDFLKTIDILNKHVFSSSMTCFLRIFESKRECS